MLTVRAFSCAVFCRCKVWSAVSKWDNTSRGFLHEPAMSSAAVSLASSLVTKHITAAVSDPRLELVWKSSDSQVTEIA